MKILITGATGLLGNNLTRLALAQGFEVTTLSRSPRTSRSIIDLECQHVQCDLNDPSLNDRLDQLDVECVIHSAALVHIGWQKTEDSLRINRDGTQAIVKWANQRKLRGIYISTVNTLPIGDRDNPAHEDSIGDGQIPSAYVLSKRAAQQVVNQTINEGHDWFSIYPGFMLGPYDWQLSSGKMIQPLQRFMPWAPAGGCSVCDPRDVSQGILRLAKHGNELRHFVMAGVNIPYFDLWTKIAHRLQSKPPVIAMKLPAKVISQISADLINMAKRDETAFNSAAIEMAQQFHYYSSERARKHLGYRNREIATSIDDAVTWLADHDYLPIYSQRHLPKLAQQDL